MQFRPQQRFYINSVATLRLLQDKRHLSVLNRLSETAYSIRELADSLKTTVSEITQVVTDLEDHQLIILVEERSTDLEPAEKLFQAIAHQYIVSEDLISDEGIDENIALAMEFLDATQRDLIAAQDLVFEPVLSIPSEFSKAILYLTDEEAHELVNMLSKVWERYDRSEKVEGTRPYSLLISFLPSSSP